jgi:hypothetical protein
VINSFSKKLGFTEENSLIATVTPDLRIPEYGYLYIKNILEDKPICVINPTNFTPVDVSFAVPITIDKFSIMFTDSENNQLNFEGKYHIIELRLFLSA